MIVKVLFGSHLYGTSTPQSDKDYKGIGFQDRRDLLINGPKKHLEYSSTGDSNKKNTNEDIDVEIFTLHEFIKLTLAGQTVGIDLLHANKESIIETSKTWEFIQKNRSKFYSKKIESFLCYCIKQAAKYSIKGSRLNDVEKVIEWLNSNINSFGDISLYDANTINFPTGDHIKFVENSENYKLSMYDICGKKITLTTKLEYAKSIFEKYHKTYGERAKLAQQNESIDWKAISHAFRAAYQMKELFKTSDLIFPLKDAKFITEVKLGQHKYIDLAPMLEDLIDEVKELRDSSDFPEEPDTEFWHDFIINMYG